MISAAIICLNEEKLIARCIYNVMWADEVVIIDGGSLDRTKDIIRDSFFNDKKVRWYNNTFRRHFGDQKNLAISMCKGDWIFVLDADETIEDGLVEELKSIATEKNEYDAVNIPRKNFIDGMITDAYPDYQSRFFRNFCRYIYPVHEELVGWRKTCYTEHHILHYKSNDRFNDQQRYYRKIISEMGNKFRRPHENW